jgi:hypothetical protein
MVLYVSAPRAHRLWRHQKGVIKPCFSLRFTVGLQRAMTRAKEEKVLLGELEAEWSRI